MSPCHPHVFALQCFIRPRLECRSSLPFWSSYPAKLRSMATCEGKLEGLRGQALATKDIRNPTSDHAAIEKAGCNVGPGSYVPTFSWWCGARDVSVPQLVFYGSSLNQGSKTPRGHIG